MIYVHVKDAASEREFILMEARLCQLYADDTEYSVLSKMPGQQLVGLVYEPILPYFQHMRQERGAFRVLCDTYVTAESGTGVVHQAPYHGEDDYRVCLAAGIITRDMAAVCPVDASGCFTEPVTDFLVSFTPTFVY